VSEKIFNNQEVGLKNSANSQPETDYLKKLRRRVEDRIRKDEEALLLVARVLNMK
jgi:hypothetical protein